MSHQSSHALADLFSIVVTSSKYVGKFGYKIKLHEVLSKFSTDLWILASQANSSINDTIWLGLLVSEILECKVASLLRSQKLPTCR